jgi:hypothetical protein
MASSLLLVVRSTASYIARPISHIYDGTEVTLTKQDMFGIVYLYMSRCCCAPLHEMLGEQFARRGVLTHEDCWDPAP